MRNWQLFINFLYLWGVFIFSFVACKSEQNETLVTTNSDLPVSEATNSIGLTTELGKVPVMRKDSDTFVKKTLPKNENVSKNIDKPNNGSVIIYPQKGKPNTPVIDTAKIKLIYVSDVEPSKDSYDTNKYKYVKDLKDGKWRPRAKNPPVKGQEQGPAHHVIMNKK